MARASLGIILPLRHALLVGRATTAPKKTKINASLARLVLSLRATPLPRVRSAGRAHTPIVQGLLGAHLVRRASIWGLKAPQLVLPVRMATPPIARIPLGALNVTVNPTAQVVCVISAQPESGAASMV